MIGDGHPLCYVFGGGEGAVDGVEAVAQDAEEDAAGAFSAADRDEDFLIFGVSFDASDCCANK